MRKSFISLGFIAAAAFALTNCSNEIEQPFDKPETAGIPFEITASTPDTKTVNDGLSTDWTTGDALNVFHAVSGSQDYVDDGKFSYISNNSFTGTLASEPTGDATDWYVFYPYSQYVKTPASVNSGYMDVGARTLVQTGNSNMEHLAGKYFPMCGKGTINNGADVSLSMNHLVSVIQIDVTNNLPSQEPLTISNISFTGTEDIVGTYYINFAGAGVVYTKSGSDYVYNTANLSVANGEEIEYGEKASFYIGVKPFTAQAGAQLSLSINSGDLEKDLVLQDDVTFFAGKIKKVSISYNEELPEQIPEVTYTMIDQISNLSAGKYYMSGYLESYQTNDWSANPYHVFTGVSTDLFTSPHSYSNGVLTQLVGESYSPKEVLLETVTGESNTYYVKVDNKYLYSSEKSNRKLGLTETATKWVASDNANGGITLTTAVSDGTVSLGTAGASSKLLRSYVNESTLKYGLVFFKENE